jgi:pentatricopeptide repeat protein
MKTAVLNLLPFVFASVEAGTMVSGDTGVLGLLAEVISSLSLEICFLIFFALGYGLLRLDRFSRRNPTQKAAKMEMSPFMMKMKGVRSEYQAGNLVATVAAWRDLAASQGTKECCTLETFRIVINSILGLENEEESLKALKELAKYIASFKDPYAAIPHQFDDATKKRNWGHARNAQEGLTRILNQLLHSASVCRSSRIKMDTVFSTLQEIISAKPNDETYEALAGAYAGEGNVARVEEILGTMTSQNVVTPRAYSMVINGFLQAKMLPEARTYIQKQLQVSAVAQYNLAELAKITVPFDGPQKAITELRQISQRGNSVVPSDAIVVCLEEAMKRGCEGIVAETVEEMTQKFETQLTYLGHDALIKAFASSANLRAIDLFDKLSDEGYHVSEGSCVGILTNCADSRFIKLAEHIVRRRRESKEMTLSIYSALMKVYASAKMYSKCCDLYPEVLAEGIEPDAVMIGCLMNFAARAGRSDLSSELFSSSKHPAEVQNYMSQIRACRQTGDVKRAMKMLRELRAKGLGDKAAFNSVLDVCVCSGQMVEALALFNEQQGELMECDVIAYNTLIKGYCNQRQVGKAVEMFERLKKDGFDANDVSYNSILNSYIRDRDFEAAWAWFEKMKSDGFEEDSYTVSTFVKALKNCNNDVYVNRVLYMLDNTKVDITSDEVLLNVVLDAFVRLKDMKRLTSVVKLVKTMAMVPPVATINTLMKAFNSLKQIDEVMELWRVMTEVRELEPNDISIGCVTDALVSNERVDEAAEFLRSVKKKYPLNTVIYSTLIKGFAITRNAGAAWEAFEDMKAENIAPNLVTMNTLIDAHARAGKMDKCAEILGSMKEYFGIEPDRITYSTIVKGFCMMGHIDQAVAVMESARRTGFAADVIIYNTILDGCSTRDHFEMCDRLYNQMIEDGVKPTNFTLTVMIKRFGREGELDKAFEVAETVPARFGFKPNQQAFTCLISACVMNRSMGKALSVLKKMKEEGPYPDNMPYEKIISGFMRNGEALQAYELVREAYALDAPMTNWSNRTSGAVTPGGSARALSIDTKILERLIELLGAKGMAESHAVPLVQELRKQKVSIPQRLVAYALRGATSNIGHQGQGRREERTQAPASRSYADAPWARSGGRNGK